MVLNDVRQIAHQIVDREGGYVNDPDDPGGATKFGVTIHTLRRLGLDLDKDGAITSEDVRRLSRDQAVEIFLDHYFTKPRLGELPQALQASVFDMYVNAGGNAVKILQRLLGDMGHRVSVDGVLGPQTLAATEAAFAAAPHHMVDAYGIARRNYYFGLADRRPTSRKYARTRAGQKGGWIKRAEEFISPRYHMNRARVCAAGGGMGLITQILTAVFGSRAQRVAQKRPRSFGSTRNPMRRGSQPFERRRSASSGPGVSGPKTNPV